MGAKMLKLNYLIDRKKIRKIRMHFYEKTRKKNCVNTFDNSDGQE